MKKIAFTLAETLITIGIIGVVAALTIPTLMQNYRKHEVETKLLKFSSSMNHSIKLSTIENGETESWDNLGVSSSTTATYDDIYNWFMKYIAPYYKYSHLEQGEHDELRVYLYDGSMAQFSKYIYDIGFYIRPRCIEKKNCISGVNAFNFRFYPNNLSVNNKNMKYSVSPNLEPYSYAWDGTMEGAKYSTMSSTYGCYQETRALCTRLIQQNGWKIPKDYPYKF